MFKYLLPTFIVFFITTQSVLAEEEATEVDGFCVSDVLAMERATSVEANGPSVRGKVKDFYEKALKLATEQYKKNSVYYEGSKLRPARGWVLFGKRDSVSKRRLLGVKISLDMEYIDEDVITYYYYNNDYSEEPRLKMYLLSEQSSQSYWTCEL